MALGIQLASPAFADDCEISNNDILSCTDTTASGDVSYNLWDTITGLFEDDMYDGCGVTHDYDDGADVWGFTCGNDAPVTIDLSGNDCNVDLFVMDDDCSSGSSSSCLDASNSGGANNEQITFDCEEDRTYFIIVERKGAGSLNPFADCNIYSARDYDLEADCNEICDDLVDNDADDLVDCLDTEDCPPCFEECTDGVDNDFDGLIDCDDPDCADDGVCCDMDGDGYWAAGDFCGGDDCNDNPLIGGTQTHPGATEGVADGVDSNCDGLEDCYLDEDGDFYGVPEVVSSAAMSCLATGVADNDDDCDDEDGEVNPGSPEVIANGVDDNCDGVEICYVDSDGDGFGSGSTTTTSDVTCTSAGHATNFDDCDDLDAAVYPGAPEVVASGIDEDCDGLELCYIDDDGDTVGHDEETSTGNLSCVGPGLSLENDDCDDTPGTGAAIHPDAEEAVADGIDSNCDGLEKCWDDDDYDTYGNDQMSWSEIADVTCSLQGWSARNDDCNDSNASIHPGAPDPAGDGIDQNCDALQECYVDADGDGIGGSLTISSTSGGCTEPYVSELTGDCDDSNAGVYPGAVEGVADGIDQDCDNTELCYTDADEDGYGGTGTESSTDLTCTTTGVSTNDLDCLDVGAGASGIHPGATEVANDGIDQNCDGLETCFEDQDSDGYGSTTLVNSPSLDCSVGNVSSNSDDCDDSTTGFTIHPGADELPASGVDEDCDGKESCYTDGDGDNFGQDTTFLTTDLTCITASGASNNNNDCDDSRSDVYPGAPQGSDAGVDYDCSGFSQCFVDADNDGYGSSTAINSSDPLCNLPGVADNSSDCDDSDAALNPSATEIADNGVDENCDGYESCYLDYDEDGFGSINPAPSTDLTCNADGVSSLNTDCDDYDDGIHPGAVEAVADNVDSNCDGTELCWTDVDQDGYGRSQTQSSTDITCQTAGVALQDGDCNDAVATIHPDAVDIPANGIDEDCDNLYACYEDLDDDSYGTILTVDSTSSTCSTTGSSQLATDCNDDPETGGDIHPGATEIPGNGIDENCDGIESCYLDGDGDGYGGAATQASAVLNCSGPGLSLLGTDCDDGDANRYPGATETVADGIDSDCDGKETCWLDADGDTFGGPLTELSAQLNCLAPGVSDNNDDCFDQSPEGASIYPGAVELPADSIDSDCDGLESCYDDGDGDGYGTNTTVDSTLIECNGPGVSPRQDDCDDADYTVHPDQAESPADNLDSNCDGMESCWTDADGDTYGSSTLQDSTSIACTAPGVSTNDDDCNDTPPDGYYIHPGATEVVGNSVDENCDGSEDCYTDADDDGWGSTVLVASTSMDCSLPGRTASPGDCDDGDDTIHPGADEVAADGIDQDCDGGDACFQDLDDDGYGTEELFYSTDMDCNDWHESTVSTDCVDGGSLLGISSSMIHPGAIEVCNGVDDDCDEQTDDEDASLQSAPQWWADDDGDGFGDDLDVTSACDAPDGYVGEDGDCDDDDANVNPDALEICDPNDVDENCNGVADETDPTVTDAELYHPDDDGDGYGSDDPMLAALLCDASIPGYITDGTDCDDTEFDVNPGEEEVVYDGFDNDCDPLTLDDDLDQDGFDHTVDCNDVPPHGASMNSDQDEVSWPNHIDDDCDGYTDEGTIAFDDDGDGFTENGGDCDDDDITRHPGATETANAVDDNCNGTVDENTSVYDDDGDGFTEAQGDCNDYAPAVFPGAVEQMSNGIDDDCDGSVDGGAFDEDGDGYAIDGGDCDDTDASVYPGSPELPDTLDNDCDGTVDEGTSLFDDDGDGQSEAQGDCNDANPDTNTGATEVANGVDDDCDGIIDNHTSNSDDDQDGFAENQGDCDDANPNVHPGAEELGNGVDDDCDGQIDEGLIDIDQDGYTTEAGDCDDLDGWAHPDMDEMCDGVDNDCDGVTDENCAGGQELADTGLALADGSGCNQGGGSPAWLGLLLLPALVRRRRAA